ncbi:MAG: hypothetical protein FJX52_16675, partial [Alphaproteobacteria bacterium]|nr:hypothetical protein [Alphaproteobacteria bacterium]
MRALSEARPSRAVRPWQINSTPAAPSSGRFGSGSRDCSCAGRRIANRVPIATNQGRSKVMTKMRVHRVGGVLAAIAAALGLASQAHSQAMDKLTVRLDWAPHGMHAPIHLAIEKGWFKRANLDVQVEDGNGSVVTTQLVGSGNFDVGHANLSSVAMGKSKGIPVISIAGFVRKS